MSEVLSIRVDGTNDRDGTKLRALLDAQFAYERARATRCRCLPLLALACGLSWVAGHSLPGIELWPIVRYPWAVAHVGTLVRTCQMLVCARTVLAVAVEWQRYRRWMHAIVEHGGASFS